MEEFDVARWRKVVDVNLVGYSGRQTRRAGCEAQAAAPSSRSTPSRARRAASKLGLRRQQVRRHRPDPEHRAGTAEFGVRVNAICPGNLLDSPLWVESLYGQYAARLGITEEEVRQRYVDQVPMKRGCTTRRDQSGRLLASDQSGYMTDRRSTSPAAKRCGDAMALTGNRTFVGFGFGAIQAGLFLYEANSAGTFGGSSAPKSRRIALRGCAAGGLFTVNIAHADHIERPRWVRSSYSRSQRSR
ncbi:MAG: hypothetical protein R2838_18725 [Caldilineaceae bacterium]